jgi:hypothetical protein
MSRRFRLYSWGAAISDLLIASVFFSSHPAMTGPSWHYVFLLVPWQFWTAGFFSTGIAMCMAIGAGCPKKVRKAACCSTVLQILWATEFGFVLPSVVANKSVSWMGLVLVGSLAFFKLVYLGMPATKWLDLSDDNEYSNVLHIRER